MHLIASVEFFSLSRTINEYIKRFSTPMIKFRMQSCHAKVAIAGGAGAIYMPIELLVLFGVRTIIACINE